jgi:hypothetical protein
MVTALCYAVPIIRKVKIMTKKFLLIALLISMPKVFAFDDYVSPETYAINEADFTDYRYIPPTPRPSLDELDNYTPTAVEEPQTTVQNVEETKTKKMSKKDKEEDPEAYKKRISYKVAKWWVDKRYEREEPHHGTKHEIKVQARMDYEKKLEEKIN